MSEWNERRLVELLSEIPVPGMTRNIVEYGMVSGVALEGNRAAVELEVLARDDELPRAVKEAVEAKLRAAGLEPVVDMQVKRFPSVAAPPQAGPAPASQPRPTSTAPLGPHGTSPDPWADRQPLPGVRYVVAVASGKGGVGKSTVAVNLAYALQGRGLRVGLLDADIYGPSTPIMLGIEGDVELEADAQRRIKPIEKEGLQTISIGYLIHDDQPVIWRGPLVMKTIVQFLRGVAWSELDVLVVDLPPGTGDAQLSLVQKVPIDGAVIVTTPQRVAVADVIRGHAMFDKVGVPVLGVVENMSWLEVPSTGERIHVFGRGGGARAAAERGVPLLAEIPLDPATCDAMDAGRPVVLSAPESAPAHAFASLAEKVWSALEARGTAETT